MILRNIRLSNVIHTLKKTKFDIEFHYNNRECIEENITLNHDQYDELTTFKDITIPAGLENQDDFQSLITFFLEHNEKIFHGGAPIQLSYL